MHSTRIAYDNADSSRRLNLGTLLEKGLLDLARWARLILTDSRPSCVSFNPVAQ